MRGLTVLHVSANKLTRLPAGAFAGLGALTDLDVSQNAGITRLPAELCDHLGRLERFSLRNCRCATLPENFGQLGSLTFLQLDANGPLKKNSSPRFGG